MALAFVLAGCGKPPAPAAKPDPAVAQFRELIAAAETGDREAQNDAGNAWRRGEGTAPNPTNALKYYRMAAEQGLDKSQYHTARAYQTGEGAAKDLPEAFRWMTRAAEQGHAKAQYQLGMLHARGEGTPKDLAKAEKWLILAGSQGEKDASVSRQVLEGVMTPAQIEDGKKQALAFTPKRTSKKEAAKKNKPAE